MIRRQLVIHTCPLYLLSKRGDSHERDDPFARVHVVCGISARGKKARGSSSRQRIVIANMAMEASITMEICRSCILNEDAVRR